MLWAVLASGAAGAAADPGTSAMGLGAKKFLTFMGAKNPHQGNVNFERQTYPNGDPSSCFPLIGESVDDAASFGDNAVDYECMQWRKKMEDAESKGEIYASCRSGMPFYRLLSNAMTEDTCVNFCIARGFDLAGIVRATECRCGATPHNTAVWGDSNLEEYTPLAPPGASLAVDQNDDRCAMVILQMPLRDGQVQKEFLDEDEVDATYRASIITGTLVTSDGDEPVNIPQGDTDGLQVWTPNGAKGIDTFDPNAFHAAQAVEDVLQAGGGAHPAGSESGEGEEVVQSMAEMMQQAKQLAKKRHVQRQGKKKQRAPKPEPVKKTDAEVLELLKTKALARSKRLGVPPHPKLAMLQKKEQGLEAKLEEAEAAAAQEWKDGRSWLVSEGKALAAEGRALAAAGATGLQEVERHLRAGVEAAEQAVATVVHKILDVEGLERTDAAKTKLKVGEACADREPDQMEPPLCLKSVDDCASKATCERLTAASDTHPRGYCDVDVVADNCPGSCLRCASPIQSRHCGDADGSGCAAATLWPRDSKSTDGYVVVWYKFDETKDADGNLLLDETRKASFLAAAADIEAKTCLRFGDAANDVRFSGMAHMAPGFINVENKDADRCAADGSGWPGIGKSRNLNLGRCGSALDVGNVEHSLVYAIGGFHENQRPDAQTALDGKGPFLQVDWTNVQNEWKRSYDPIDGLHRGDADGGFRPFNYESIMMTAPSIGAVDGTKPTYQTLPVVDGVGVFDSVVGQRKALSAGDALVLNAMYGCADEKVLMRYTNKNYLSACRDKADEKFDRGTCAGFRRTYAVQNNQREACDWVFCPTCEPVDLGDLGKLGPGDCDLECNACAGEPPQGEVLAGLGQMLAKAANEQLASVEYYKDLTPVLELLSEIAQSSLQISKLPVQEGNPFGV